jgi:hypothetical protein
MKRAEPAHVVAGTEYGRRRLLRQSHLVERDRGACQRRDGKPVSDLSVSDREGRTTWRPLLESLTAWLVDADPEIMQGLLAPGLARRGG